MQIHLFESASSKPMVRQMGKHNLALCMLAMGELRKLYISADATYKLFKAATDKVENASTLESAPVAAVPAEGRWESWLGGYGVSTEHGASDLWTPFSNTSLNGSSVTHADAWLDIQSMDQFWTIDDLGLS